MATQANGAGRAVQYLRMSTEHQRYSLENQSAVIAEFAALEGYEIVRTYSDAGRSGLQLKGRRQLQQLLSDCLSPDRDFSAILVLDVSRWGRFQDPDQAAYYEYTCRGAGVRVAYVGETFDNDGGLVSSIVKHIKRVMAAEYSRELSAKVTRAKLQQARLGFRQGGAPGYGFRRQLVDAAGRKRQTLKTGQRKGIQTDRITTAPGPAAEQETIRRIFKLFVGKHRNFAGVARQLNEEGVPSGNGRPWTRTRVGHLIRNEACVGDYVYNRTNRQLRQPTTHAPPEEWVRVPVMDPVVPREVFAKAGRLAGCTRYRYPTKHLVQALRRHLKRYGSITAGEMIDNPSVPHPATYRARFGSLDAACKLVGHTYESHRGWRRTIRGFWTRDSIIAAVRRLHAEGRPLSASVFNADLSLPSVRVISQRFGGLIGCYEAAGVPLTPVQQAQKEARAVSRRFSVPEGLELGPIATSLVNGNG